MWEHLNNKKPMESFIAVPHNPSVVPLINMSYLHPPENFKEPRGGKGDSQLDHRELSGGPLHDTWRSCSRRISLVTST